MRNDVAFQIRLDAEHRRLLCQVATAHCRNQSDLLRYLLRQEGRRIGLLDTDDSGRKHAVHTPTVPADADDCLSWE